jgi:hypothetical protein
MPGFHDSNLTGSAAVPVLGHDQACLKVSAEDTFDRSGHGQGGLAGTHDKDAPIEAEIQRFGADGESRTAPSCVAHDGFARINRPQDGGEQSR